MIFSSRLPDTLSANPFSATLAEKKAAGAELLDLTLSNPTLADLSSTVLTLAAIAAPGIARYQPQPQGARTAREAVCAYYRNNRYCQEIDPGDLFLTASTSEAYSYLFKLLTDPGDEILLPAPGYPLFDFLAGLDRVEPHRYTLRQERQGRWRIDFPRLKRQITRRTRAIVAVHPNNPTGSYLTAEEMAQLGQLCQSRDLALIVDEVFLDYPGSCGPAAPISALTENSCLTFVLSGFSKILALPQAKLSWLHVGGPPALRREAKQRLEFIADSYLSVGIIQHWAGELLSHQSLVQEEIRRRLAVNEATLVAAKGMSTFPREGGWYAIIQLPDTVDDEECCLELLRQHNIIVHPGFFYDFPSESALVVSLLCPEANFARGVRLLQEFLRALPNA